MQKITPRRVSIALVISEKIMAHMPSYRHMAPMTIRMVAAIIMMPFTAEDFLLFDIEVTPEIASLKIRMNQSDRTVPLSANADRLPFVIDSCPRGAVYQVCLR